MKKLLSLVFVAALAIAPALGDTNLAPNGSFEDAPNGAYTTSGNYKYVSASGGAPFISGVNTTLVTGWTVTALPQGGKYGLASKNVFSPSESSTGDTQALFIQDYNNAANGGILISDSLGTIAANSTYKLSLNIGAPPTLTGLAGYTAGETAPQVYFALLGNGGVITSQTLADTSVTENGLTNYTLSFTTGASGGFVGDALTIKLQAVKQSYGTADPGGEVAIFDDVVVTAPEPSTYALLLMGAGLVVLVARRRMVGLR